MAWYYGHGGLSTVGYGNNKRLMSQSLNAHLFVYGRPESDICQCHSQAIEPVDDFFQVLAVTGLQEALARELHSHCPIV